MLVTSFVRPIRHPDLAPSLNHSHGVRPTVAESSNTRGKSVTLSIQRDVGGNTSDTPRAREKTALFASPGSLLMAPIGSSLYGLLVLGPPSTVEREIAGSPNTLSRSLGL